MPTAHTIPGDITAGPDGNLWFTLLGTTPQTGMIGRISLSGAVATFSLPANSFSHSITMEPDGNLWFKEPDKIGRMTPTGQLTEFPLSTRSLVDTQNWPAALYGSTLWGDIASGLDGFLWFSEPLVTPIPTGKIGRITPSGGLSEFPLPTPHLFPLGMTAGPDGNLWFTAVDYGIPLGGKIGRIAPTGTVSLFSLPPGFFRFRSQPDRMGTSGGPKRIWKG